MTPKLPPLPEFSSTPIIQKAFEELARAAQLEAWKAAMECAAQVVDSVNNYDNPMTATDCADEIRSASANGVASAIGEVVARVVHRKG